MFARRLFLIIVGFLAISPLYGRRQSQKIIFTVEKERKIQGLSISPNDYLEFNSDGMLLLARCKKTTNYYNTTWPQNTTFEFNKYGYLESCTFYSTVVVHGFPCKQKVEWSPQGKPLSFTLAKPHKINGYLCDIYYVRLSQSGKIRYCKLAKNRNIDGYPCAPEIVRFSDVGRLTSFTLAEDRVMNNILFHKGSQIFLHRNGNIWKCIISKTTKIEEFLVGTYNMPEIYFYENGQVERFHLLKPATIKGYACAARHTGFYPSGKLHYAQLRNREKIQGMYCNAADISFYKNGNLKSCVLTKPVLLGGIWGTGKSGFHTSGNFRYCEIAQDIKLGKVSLVAGDHVTLDDENKIINCWLSRKRNILGKTLKKSTNIWFYKNAKIKSIGAQQILRIQGYLCQGYNKIHFHNNGKIKEFISAENIILDNLSFPANTHLVFRQNGEPARATYIPYSYEPPKYVSRKYTPIKINEVVIPNNIDVVAFVKKIFYEHISQLAQKTIVIQGTTLFDENGKRK
ncbi:hypothetical protein [Candidatus Uabimicrobium sp. HlEnr_7]|uniref:hypothetical protein n=1 Tax=Candidatus Uabimicrobium helgolandensis TaxID=3095367 RepID=UPI003555C980